MKFEKYYKLVENQALAFDKTQNCFLGQTWKYHLLPVINNAIFLAERYGADKDVVEAAAVFHDYANLIDYANSENHHSVGASLAGEILKKDGFDEAFIEKVKKCIFNHRASVVFDKFTTEEICVADADAMTHLQNVVELILWRGYIKENIEDANNFIKNKIRKDFNKMSEKTKNLMQERYDAIMKILY